MNEVCDLEKNAVLFRDVNVSMGDVRILENVSARIPLESSTAVVGPNGAGKTSLTLALLGQMPYRGRIEFPCLEGGRRLPRFGFVPQVLQFDRDMPMTVMDFLLSGMQRMPLFLGKSARLQRRAEAMLEEVECARLSGRLFGALSGGEIQRVLLAQALLQEPEILILDEPTAGVDFKGGQICCELLNKIRESRKFTQLMVSHDLATVAAHATHVICLNHRVYAEGRPRDVLTHKVLSETFGLHMGIPSVEDIAGDALVCGADCTHHHHHHHHHSHHDSSSAEQTAAHAPEGCAFPPCGGGKKNGETQHAS